MNPKDEDFICFYRDAVLAGHDDPAAETMRRFNLSRDYTVRLLNEAIAPCDGKDIRNWNRRNEVARAPLTNARATGNGGYSADNLASCYEATPMNKSESLKRAAECTRLAGTSNDPEMQAYLLKLGLSWMQVAAEPDERLPEGSRRLKTLQDLVG